MRKMISLLPLLLLAICSFAQQKMITGTVSSKTDKSPLVGVSVQSKGKTALTDANGKFSIAASVGESLEFSYVGLKSVSIKITDNNLNVSVEMEEALKQEEQVVVVGYTSQRKKI